MKKILLVISGKLKHGKDTFANNIIDKLSIYDKIKVQKTAFANPIKEMSKIMFPQISDKDLWGSSQNRNNIVKGCINPENGHPLTVRDVLIKIGKYGRSCNKIIRIIRPDIIQSSSDESETNLDNVSLDFYDFVIINNSLKKIKEEASKIVRLVNFN